MASTKKNRSLSLGILLLAGCGIVLLMPSAPAGAENEVDWNRQWAQQAFSADPASAPAARNQLIVIHEDSPGDTKVGRCAAGGPLRLGDKTYPKGIGVNSHSVLRVTLLQPAQRFQAVIGLDRNVDQAAASVRFHVQVEGKDVFATDIMKPADGFRPIDIPLKGAHSFDLVVDDGGDGRGWDQADWAEARVILADGSELWLDDLANVSRFGSDFPFSFVYGGKKSSELLGNWKKNVEDKILDPTRQQRTLTLTDPQTGLEVKAVATIYTDTAGVDWTVYFTNTSGTDTPVLEQVQALDVTITPGTGTIPVLHRIHGSHNGVDDWMNYDETLSAGKAAQLVTVEGRASLKDGPFFNLDFGSSGVITAIGWSGQWTAKVENSKEGSVRMQAGMQFIHTKLHPGETIRTPRILQLYWFGQDELRSYNLFRQTMLAHIVPKLNSQTAVPPITHLSTSFYELNYSTQEHVLSHLESIAGLGFEYFWLDAYFTRDGFAAGMGNYGLPVEEIIPDPIRFPRGLKPVADAVAEQGYKFLLWFEPERVVAGTYIAKNHPEYVISPDNNGGGLFNLGNPQAREYMTKVLLAAIKEYRLGCLRFDYNLNPLPYWQFENQKDPDRVGICEIRYMEGLYQMWDDIRRVNPHLLIDDCASGGTRIDLETMSRALPLWRTDGTIFPLLGYDFNQAAMLNQIMTAGLNRYVPFSTSGMMGATPYLFRSGVNGGGISFCEDVRPLDYNRDTARKGMSEYNVTLKDRKEEYPRDLLKKGIAEAKRIRKYYFGNYYPLTPASLSPKDWCAMQYHRPAEQDGMIVAFRRHESPYSGFDSSLFEIDPQARYQITKYAAYDPAEPVVITGTELQKLKLIIDDCPGSLLIEYKKIAS